MMAQAAAVRLDHQAHVSPYGWWSIAPSRPRFLFRGRKKSPSPSGVSGTISRRPRSRAPTPWPFSSSARSRGSPSSRGRAKERALTGGSASRTISSRGRRVWKFRASFVGPRGASTAGSRRGRRVESRLGDKHHPQRIDGRRASDRSELARPAERGVESAGSERSRRIELPKGRPGTTRGGPVRQGSIRRVPQQPDNLLRASTTDRALLVRRRTHRCRSAPS